MKDLKEIYERIAFLRQKGVKMKEMAEQAKMSPSVLSALYSTVLPAYFKGIEKGADEDAALNEALMWVNNVSKKKLLASLPQLKSSLLAMEVTPKVYETSAANPFLSTLEANMRESVKRITPLSGIYQIQHFVEQPESED